MIDFKDYRKFTLEGLNIVDPDTLPSDISLRVFGEFQVIRRKRDKKIMILLPNPERRPEDWKKVYSERVFWISVRGYKKSKVKSFTITNTLYFYSQGNAFKFLDNVEELNIGEWTNNFKEYEYLDPKRKIIISR